MKHYTKEELELYRNRKMSLLGRLACAAHLRKCPECAKRLEELKADDSFVAEIQESIAAYEGIPAPQTAATPSTAH